MTETIDKPTTAIAEYSPTAAALADLRARFADVVFDVTTTKGDKEARAARMELVKLRTSLEAKRKELKAPALERSRLIDAEAKRIEAEILALETPIDEQIKAEEARRERERQAKAEAERRRVAAIQERIDEIKAFPVRAAGSKSSIVMEARIGDLVAIEIDDTFAEFRPAAEAAHAQALATMRELLEGARTHEEEVRRLRAEQEALEQQRREDEARRAEADRIAREQHEAEVARIRAEREAEEARLAEARAAQEAELRAQREAEEARAAEQRRIDAERQAEEQRRLDAERAELERQQAELDRQRREQDEREAAARAEAERIERERIEAAQRAERARQQAEYEAECRLEEAAPKLLSAARLALALLERCESHIAEGDRATDAEWDATVAALREAIALADEPATA